MNGVLRVYALFALESSLDYRAFNEITHAERLVGEPSSSPSFERGREQLEVVGESQDADERILEAKSIKK